VLDLPVNNPVGELAATEDRRFLGGVGVRATEGSQTAVAANQQVEGPASRSIDAKRPRGDRKTLVREKTQRPARMSDNLKYTATYRCVG
jgi:hypothetical protein